MTIEDLQKMISTLTPEDFKKAFIKTEKSKNQIFEIIKGSFIKGRTPFIHQTTFPNGSQIRLKFYNVVKHIRNSKGQEVVGKESFLSYLDVSVLPANQKGYSFTTDVNQIVWGTSKSQALEKHNKCLQKLVDLATELGIDLSDPVTWCTTYSENY